jgi:hypothetical protein
MKKIIFAKNGQLAVMIGTNEFLASLDGTEEEKLIHCANRNLPTGTKYEIIESTEMPDEHDFFDAWEYVADASVERTSADLTDAMLATYGMVEQQQDL